ncbi:MAG TPA: hypothetical protein VK436_07195 [Methanocella sp.]|nr:hypothetical protein [Methanocella sp.]
MPTKRSIVIIVLLITIASVIPTTIAATAKTTKVDCDMKAPDNSSITPQIVIPERLGWNQNISANNSTFGIIRNCSNDEDNLLLNQETGEFDVSPFTDTQNMLPWPIIKSAAPSTIKSGTTTNITINFEYPFPGATADVVDLLPSGLTNPTNFKLDGKPITPNSTSGGNVAFNNIPSPSSSSPSGVRTITFTATASTVSSPTQLKETAYAQFFARGSPYGPPFYWSVRLTVIP